ncbi:hypothetical protein TRAPUB_3375 [Trametes pubescens]|uniref:Uncharacterized protein n=1 Tax=Trametes pubescens TaxID=154538 RepID=A0A1M2VE20_TRAPU|nr:hypothetical protein TRAPUB_3375 [Trametes pubescens]
MKEENILENVNARSKELFEALDALRANPKIAPVVLDVRGQGLMVAVEFASPVGTGPFRDASAPAKLASCVAQKRMEKAYSMLIRRRARTSISQADLAKGCAVFAEAVEEVVKEG